jgi:hypothetical protein
LTGIVAQFHKAYYATNIHKKLHNL